MKLTCFFLIIACLHVSAGGFAQKVTISGKKIPLQQVFDQIQDQTGYGVFMDYDTLKKSKPVTLDLKNATIDQVLKKCFEGQPWPLTYIITGHTINIIKVGDFDGKRPAVDAFPAGTPPTIIQEFKGRVTNESGEPLQGATVEIQNGKAGAFTDVNGIFILRNIPTGAVLKISFTGYEAKQIKMTGESVLHIVMKLTTNKLDEVQIIAYGTTTQRLNTGDVSTVTSKEIEEQPVANPLAALEGRVPGMFITQGTGAPGGSFTVQIRGQNSIQNGNDPLYIIDGVPYASELLDNINAVGNFGNPLNFINPSDIANIEVLKDADATAIYGSRGANGVVLINTKKGSNGPSRVDLNVYSGDGQITRKIKWLNTPEYLQMRQEALQNDGLASDPTVDFDLLSWDTTRYTDWQKALIGGTAHYTDVQGSASGGNDNVNYLIGGGYHRETTVFPGDLADQKGSVHFQVNGTSTNRKFKIQLSGNYVADYSNLVYADFTSFLSFLPPDAPKGYNPDGTINWAGSTWTNGGNPYALLQNKYKGRTSNLISGAVLSYELLPGLQLKANAGYTNLQLNETVIYPLTGEDPAYNLSSGSSEFNTSNIRSWSVEPQINYKLKLGKGLINALAGATFEQNTNEGQTQNATGFSNDALLWDIGAATSITNGVTTVSDYKYNAFFGRVNYNLDEKYLLNLTGRRDGSSRFGPGHQFGNFGAIGAGWIFSKEAFIQHTLPALSFGKLRASYGTTGNDQVGDYKFLDLYHTTTYPYQNTQGLYPTSLFNPDLSWELSKKLEGGLELGFFGDRLGLNADYYYNRSSNQLVNYTLAAITGFTSIAANFPATVQNSGFELMVNGSIIKSKNFTWTAAINVTIPKNKLVAFPNLANSSYKNSLVIGQPVNIVQAYHLIGVNDTTGVYEYSTSKGAPTYAPAYPADRTVLINIMPRVYGGVQNSFQYKSFGLDILFQFVKQTGANFLYNNNQTPAGFSGYNQPVSVLARWQKPGDVKPIEQFSSTYASAAAAALNYIPNDQLYSDASFIRLKNLAFSYTIPSGWKKKLHLDDCRIYLQGQNLLTFTKYKGYDPENQSQTALPPLRVLTAGIQVGL